MPLRGDLMHVFASFVCVFVCVCVTEVPSCKVKQGGLGLRICVTVRNASSV